jgi:hypothetical protein
MIFSQQWRDRMDCGETFEHMVKMTIIRDLIVIVYVKNIS